MSAATRLTSRPWWRVRYDFTGLLVGLVFLCWSLTPSLLPRTWPFQGLVSGFAATTGYGVGVVGSHIFRLVVRWEPGPRLERVAWRLLPVVGCVATAVFLVLHFRWQQQLNRLMSERPPAFPYLGAVLLTAALFILLVGAARLLRRAAHRVAGALGRWLSPRAARALATLAMTVLVVGVLDGLVVRGLLRAADSSFSAANAARTDEATQPTGNIRSGSPTSLAPWDGLGARGREFVAGGPSRVELEAFNGRPAREPVRVYVGLGSGETAAARARIAVAELARTGGFTREILCVVTPTGTGWVDPAIVDSLEHMFNGDTAVVAAQYSYLPSWLSLLVDDQRARDAGSELFNHVYDRWATLPPDQRPRLLVAGESLGSTGSEDAFSGIADIRNRADGALWIGPPNFNELWRSFVDERDPGTPERLPVHGDGRTVRFAADPSDLHEPDAPWPAPRVVYLQHASDPVVWWSPRLLLREPDWLDEPRGDDVLASMRWFPFVTFWQVTADLTHGMSIPAGHGHNYADEIAGAWAAITEPEGWTPADTARLDATLEQGP